MKSCSYFICQIDLIDFSIDLDIDLRSSVDFTDRLPHHGADFIFAVGEVWFNVNNERSLIASSIRPENLIERLKDWRKIISQPPFVPGVEQVMPCGGWNAWMAGYWKRVEEDNGGAEDEDIYKLLSPLSIIDSREGGIAVYMYERNAIFEVATRSHDGLVEIGSWVAFDPERLGGAIDTLTNYIAEKIRSNMRQS